MSKSTPLHRAADLLEKKGYDGLLITSRENNRYFSGFTGSESTLLISGSGEKLFLFCDSRYTEQAKRESPDWKIIEYKRLVDAVSKKIGELKLRKVGFESRNLSYNLYRRYLEALDKAVLAPIETHIDKLRVSKSGEEIDSIGKAIRIAETAFEKMIEEMKPGVIEIEWAIALECAMRRAGSGPMPFDVIVASGERGAMPHAAASGKEIRKGEMVTVDFGAEYNGYKCDTTITFAVGRPSKEMLDVYGVVLEAHDMAIDAARPGMNLRELDGVARKHIDKKGYGKYFGHGLGHGVGLAVHEEPHVSPLAEGVVPAGSVFTIEPGIYIPGVGGVRIEDMVYMGDDRAEPLTSYPKELKVI